MGQSRRRISDRRAIGLFCCEFFILCASKEIEADALMARSGVRFQARKISWRHLIVPRAFLACHHSRAESSFFPIRLSVTRKIVPAGSSHSRWSALLHSRLFSPRYQYKHHGVPFDDKLDARPSGVSIVWHRVSCTACATSVSKCAHAFAINNCGRFAQK